MSKNLNYILVPLFYLAVALSGSAFTARRVGPWYPTLAKPSYTPPGAFIGLTVAAMIFLTRPVSSLSALLLLPYLGWVSFATFLSFRVWQLNRSVLRRDS